MKRNIIVFGLISGLIVSAMIIYSTFTCYTNGNFEGSMVLGYASMLLAFSLIFVAVKNYRDKHNNGIITFGKAFKIGLYIALISSTVYVLVWLIDYYLFVPDFMEKYAAHTLNQLKADGVSGAELAKKTSEMETYKQLYENPLYVILLTYAEILPIGLVVSLLCALILKRKNKALIRAQA